MWKWSSCSREVKSECIFVFTDAGECHCILLRKSKGMGGNASKAEQRDYWIPDDKRSKCELCESSFSLLKRRHHCRACGGIFCDDCSKLRMVVPSRGFATEVRTCRMCHLKQQAVPQARDRAQSAGAAPLTPSEPFLAQPSSPAKRTSDLKPLPIPMRNAQSAGPGVGGSTSAPLPRARLSGRMSGLTTPRDRAAVGLRLGACQTDALLGFLFVLKKRKYQSTESIGRTIYEFLKPMMLFDPQKLSKQSQVHLDPSSMTEVTTRYNRESMASIQVEEGEVPQALLFTTPHLSQVSGTVLHIRWTSEDGSRRCTDVADSVELGVVHESHVVRRSFEENAVARTRIRNLSSTRAPSIGISLAGEVFAGTQRATFARDETVTEYLIAVRADVQSRALLFEVTFLVKGIPTGKLLQEMTLPSSVAGKWFLGLSVPLEEGLQHEVTLL